ncbi:MAG: hypothetical protein QM685_07085 [Paraburkholderia sp.]
MTPRIDRVVDAHDRVSAAKQRHSGRDAGLQPFERRQMGFDLPERFVGRARINRLARGRPGIAIRAADGSEHRVSRVRVRIDKAGQHGLAARIDLAIGNVLRSKHGRLADGDDALALHGDGAIIDYTAPRIDGNYTAIPDQNVDPFTIVHSRIPCLL